MKMWRNRDFSTLVVIIYMYVDAIGGGENLAIAIKTESSVVLRVGEPMAQKLNGNNIVK